MNTYNRGSLDKTLSSFGLSDIDPELLSPSLLHNGFILDRKTASNQNYKKPGKKNSNRKNDYNNGPTESYGVPKNKISQLEGEFEFLTIRPTPRTTTESMEKFDTRFVGSSPPTLPPPSGDIPPFMMQQRLYNTKFKSSSRNSQSTKINENRNQRPQLKKPLTQSRPPFPPPIQSHTPILDKTFVPKEGVGNEGTNPILQLFQNVQKKSSSLSNLFSPKNWFQDKGQGAKRKTVGNQRNNHKFNRRMAAINGPKRTQNNPMRPLIKMVEGNFHHPAKYKYENPVLQKSRDEKSTGSMAKDNKMAIGSRNVDSKQGTKTFGTPPMDIDVAESMQIPIVHDISGTVGNVIPPVRNGELVITRPTDQSQHMLNNGNFGNVIPPVRNGDLIISRPIDESQHVLDNDLLKAEQLAAMIEALADNQVMDEAIKQGYMPMLTNVNNPPKQSPEQSTMPTMNGINKLVQNTRPTDKSLLKAPGVGMFSPVTGKRKSSYGLGFDPSGIHPESGFKPIVVGDVQSMPSLAFSVLDSMPDKVMDSQHSFIAARDMNRIMEGQISDSSDQGIFTPVTTSGQFTNRRMGTEDSSSMIRNAEVIF